MSPIASIHAWLDSRQARLLEFLESLVTIESHAANPAGVTAVADAIVEQLAPTGFTFEAHKSSRVPDADQWLEGVFSPGVTYDTLGSTYVGTAPGTSPGRLLLLGDLDTAFPVGTLETFPFRIDGNHAYGPGVADMKGGLVVLISALQVLDELGLDRPEVVVVLAGDEQAGSLSSRPIIERVGANADWCLCVECARRGGKLMAGRGHIGVGSIAVAGVEAHTGSARDSGVDALEALAHLVLELKALSDPDAGTIVTVTIAQAGRRRSVVPAQAVATVDVRTRSPHAWDSVTAAMQHVAATTQDRTGATITLRTHSHRPGIVWNRKTDHLLALARRLGAELHLDIDAFESAAAGSSAFAAPGTATLDGLGPSGGGLMTTDEHIEVDSLVPRAALLAGLIHELPSPLLRDQAQEDVEQEA